MADDLLDAAAELRARHWQSLDTGETGPAGAGIVARARSTGPLTPATALVFEEVPLTGNSWVQAADEMNTAWLKAEITNNSCVSTFMAAGAQLFLRVKVNGSRVPMFGGEGGTSPIWAAFPIDLDPGTAAPRTLTVEASHGCDTSGSFTVNSIAINVIANR